VKIFITGVAGFLGSHLADAFLAQGHEVTGIDSLIGGYRDNVPEGVPRFDAMVRQEQQEWHSRLSELCKQCAMAASITNKRSR
jgi:nucleoside-diphosphate-sugar epimerase